MFTFYKRTAVSWEHYDGIVKVGFGGGIPVFNHTANTFIFQSPNGKNYPKEAVVVNANLKIIDQTTANTEYTFLTAVALENKLVELGYPFINTGPSGSVAGVASFNGRTGIVTPANGDYTTAQLTESTNKKLVTDAEKTAITHSNRSILDAITEAFTTALKTAYDSAVAWISTNGANVLSHLASTSNPHSVTKSQVGLGDVDNTSDVNKPVSTAQQTALDTKQATLVSATNIKTINGASVLGSGDLVVAGRHSPFLIQQVNRVALTANTSAQDIFDVNSGGVTLEENSTYAFSLNFAMTGLSATSGTIGLFIGGTATITGVFMDVTAKKTPTLSTASTPSYTLIEVTTGVVITPASTSTTASVTVTGRVKLTTAGTFKPQVNMSVGATAVVKQGALLTMERLGSNTDTNG